MIVLNRSQFMGEQLPPDGMIWCVLFTTLSEIRQNVGDKVSDDLKDQIIERIGRTLGSAVGYWDDNALLINPNLVQAQWEATRDNQWTLAHEVAVSLLEKFRFRLDGHSNQNNEVIIEQDIFITPMIGLAEVSGNTLLETVRKSISAAHTVSGDNGQLVLVFDENEIEDTAAFPNFFLQQAFLQALREQKLELLYQPQVEFETGLIYGFEALLRPPADPSNPLFRLSPPELIDLATETNLLTELTVFVLRRAFSEAKTWRTISPNIPFSMSINILPRTLIEGWEAILKEIPEQNNHGLVFELTESVDGFNGSLPVLIKRLADLQARGIEISIDDFGKGLSNLDRISTIPCNEIKLDRSLIDGIQKGEANANLVRSMIHLANDRGLRVVAEGIEALDQWEFLTGISCQVGQGYYISRPMPPAEVLRLLQRVAKEGLVSAF